MKTVELRGHGFIDTGCGADTMPLSGDTKGLYVLYKYNKKPRIRNPRIVIPEPTIIDGLGMAVPHNPSLISLSGVSTTEKLYS